MKQERGLHNSLKQVRTRLGMSQQDLAAHAGVSRQTISGVEAGLYAPSATVALRLARALGCRLEELFWLDDDLPDIEAMPAAALPAGERHRLALVRVGGNWVAHPLAGEDGFRVHLVPADGEGALARAGQTVRVRLLDDPESLYRSVAVAGCTPALSLWAQAAERWHPGLRVHALFANSSAALQSLRRGEVHAAGVHLYDAESGEHNLPFVRRAVPDRPLVLVNLGFWEEGLLVRSGNPLGLRTAADLARPGLRFINREPGSGSRQLVERLLRESGVPFDAVTGFDSVVGGHVEVAREVAAGRADAGVSAAALAAAFGLGFVPLHRVRYDIVVPRAYMEEPPVQQLLATLGHRRVRSQLEALGGYDTSQTGEIVAAVNPSPADESTCVNGG